MYDVISTFLYAKNVLDDLDHLKMFVKKDIERKNQNLGGIVVLKM